MSQGYVYVLSNPDLPGVVCIGQSSAGGVAVIDEMFEANVGMQSRYRLEFEILVDDSAAVLAVVRHAYRTIRVSGADDLFWRLPEQARMTVLSVSAEAMGAEVSRAATDPRETRLREFVSLFGVDRLATHITNNLEAATGHPHGYSVLAHKVVQESVSDPYTQREQAVLTPPKEELH